ncbi:MAG: hypothetical protein PHW73_00600 [Atribacterota bacterium]|nr:hypothetical protein [Atribacterota bacterium]
MTIIELLKSEESVRITLGSRWLVYDTYSKQWEVFEHKPYHKKTTHVLQTENEQEAVASLLDAEYKGIEIQI